MLRSLACAGLVITLSACQEPLYTGISERDVNMMIMLLDKHSISAKRIKDSDNKYSLIVDTSNVTKSIKVLAAEGYPKKEFQSLGDIFNNDAIVKTPFEQRARFIHALNQELSRSLSDIDGVVSARVHVMLPENARFGEEKPEPSAAVFIMHQKDRDLTELTPKIKQLVAHSANGVKYENVSVILLPSGQTEQVPYNEPQIITSLDKAIDAAGLPTEGVNPAAYSADQFAQGQVVQSYATLSERSLIGLVILLIGGVLAVTSLYAKSSRRK